MRRAVPKKNSLRQWYLDYCQWSNDLFAQFALQLARLVLLLTRPLPPRMQWSVSAFAQLLKNFARTIHQPQYAAMWLSWRVTGKAAVDALLLGLPLFLVNTWFHSFIATKPPLALAFASVLLLGLTIAITVFFYLLASIAFVSGDAYLHAQDEFQLSAANEAGMFTLRVVVCLLLVLCLGYLFRVAWREEAILHLLLILFAARLTYIVRLLQLRWQDLTAADGDEETTTPYLRIVKDE